MQLSLLLPFYFVLSFKRYAGNSANLSKVSWSLRHACLQLFFFKFGGRIFLPPTQMGDLNQILVSSSLASGFITTL
jgi:hypothetical protein